MNPQVDLRQLAVRRDTPAPLHRRPRLVSRYLLPAVLIAGFLAVVAWAARDSFLPSRPVTVVPVLVRRGADAETAGTALFTAAGWVEPRPTPTFVTARAEGIVERLLVVEGQVVAAGEPVAELVCIDAQLSLAAAKEDLALEKAEVEHGLATLAAARANLANPATLEAALAEAEAELAKAETDLANLPFEIQAADAQERFARQQWEGAKDAGDAVAKRNRQRYQSELDMATAEIDRLKAREPKLKDLISALSNKRDAVKKQLDLKTDLERDVAQAKAHADRDSARLAKAKVEVEKAELFLERMTVRAPIAGRVLELIARPGSRVMGLDPASENESSTIVSLYDPASLQVRADVRLEDLPRLTLGQEVQEARIETAALAAPIKGKVLAQTSRADIQKNTLQVKVAIESPPPVLKPEMLVQVTFLSVPRAKAGPARTRERLWIPQQLVDSTEGGSHVWLADQAAGLARRRAVKLGQRGPSGQVEVVEGLSPADKLIAGGREGLRDGDRITITGEDRSLGVAAEPAAREVETP